jgi:hypothetical protein
MLRVLRFTNNTVPSPEGQLVGCNGGEIAAKLSEFAGCFWHFVDSGLLSAGVIGSNRHEP